MRGIISNLRSERLDLGFGRPDLGSDRARNLIRGRKQMDRWTEGQTDEQISFLVFYKTLPLPLPKKPDLGSTKTNQGLEGMV